MSWIDSLKYGLSKTSRRLSDGISDIFTKKRLDDEAIEELEDLLISADIGTNLAAEISSALADKKFDKEVDAQEVRQFLCDTISEMLTPYAQPLQPPEDRKPHVVLVVGVNGNGKTTTIGKLANYYNSTGKRVSLAACDTFRAAAVEQLQVWAGRSDAYFIRGAEGADPASVAYSALEEAQQRGDDILFIDTAGRLHNKKGLMEELAKIVRVLRKRDDTAPHDVLLVLDGTTGQNAIAQTEAFIETAGVSGLVVTKLDGTARAGVVVALAKRFNLPIHAIGVGEGKDDLRPFEAKSFAANLLGMEKL